MEELWKDIPEFEGLYQISNTGKVKSYRKSKKYKCPDNFILKNTLANNGYVQVTLYSETKRVKKLVHRLVAEAFVPNPNSYSSVNHIDENVLNNSAENLEWCTVQYNNSYGTARTRMAITRGRMIDQFLSNGQFIARYACISIASAISGVSYSRIKHCCKGEGSINSEYYWQYVNDPSVAPKDLSQQEIDAIFAK